MFRARFPAPLRRALPLVALVAGFVLAAPAAAQSDPPAAPTIEVHPGDEALTAVWEAPSGVSNITAYDVRYVLTSADETDDSNWTVEEGAWTGGALHHVLIGLTDDESYDVQVRAVTDMDGTWSATVAGTPADPASQGTALDLPLDVPLGATISPSRDVDFFKLTLDQRTSLSLFSRTDGGLDPVATLYDADGNALTADEGGLNFLIVGTLDAGTYYLGVTALSGGTGAYTVHARTIVDSTGIDDAQPVAVDAVAVGVLDEGGDEDWFRFVLAEETDLVIRSGPPIADMAGELLDSDGALIAANDDGFVLGNVRPFLIRRQLAAGAYHVKVKAFSAERTGAYSFRVEPVTDAPGTGTAEATGLEFEQLAFGRIDASADADYFRIVLSAPTHVLARAVSNAVAIDGAVEDAGGDAVEANVLTHTYVPGGTTGFMLSDLLEAGTWYLKVTRPAGSGDATGGYAIRMLEDEVMNDVVEFCSATTPPFTDPLSLCQWNLKNTGQSTVSSSGEDIRVEEVWTGGNRGADINVAVVDSGLDEAHPDLADNVDTARGHDYTGGYGLLDHGESHGTGVAGVIGARDNDLGGRGVAPRATLYGYNVLHNKTDENESDAMARNAADTAVSNNSWGPPDDPGLDPAPALWEMAVDEGVASGYGGKGVVYVWAGGNGGADGDNSNFDGYANYYGVVAVCAVNSAGKQSWYSEDGANLWVCAPSSGRSLGILTTANYGRYTNRFGGTSAAAPAVAGVVALLRAANPALTWRDVKLILAASARKNDADDSRWSTGAAKVRRFGNVQLQPPLRLRRGPREGGRGPRRRLGDPAALRPDRSGGGHARRGHPGPDDVRLR